MKRHSTDLVGLMFGSAFLIAGVGFLVRETTDTVVNPAWATGLGLMLLGAIALGATIARSVRHRDDEPLAYEHGYGAELRSFVPAYAPAAAEPETTEAPAVSDDAPTSDD